MSQDRAARELIDPANCSILNIIMERPDTLLTEIDVSNICRILQQSGFKKQKLQFQNEGLRYVHNVTLEKVPFTVQKKLEQIRESLQENTYGYK